LAQAHASTLDAETRTGDFCSWAQSRLMRSCGKKVLLVAQPS
jgi:hypothetical protein